MLYNHSEIKNKYKSTYQIRKALENKEIYKIEKGIYIDYEGLKINIYDKERMLIDLARNKNKIGYDLYKEITSNYRKLANILLGNSISDINMTNDRKKTYRIGFLDEKVEDRISAFQEHYDVVCTDNTSYYELGKRISEHLNRATDKEER